MTTSPRNSVTSRRHFVGFKISDDERDLLDHLAAYFHTNRSHAAFVALTWGLEEWQSYNRQNNPPKEEGEP